MQTFFEKIIEKFLSVLPFSAMGTGGIVKIVAFPAAGAAALGQIGVIFSRRVDLQLLLQIGHAAHQIADRQHQRPRQHKGQPHAKGSHRLQKQRKKLSLCVV